MGQQSIKQNKHRLKIPQETVQAKINILNQIREKYERRRIRKTNQQTQKEQEIRRWKVQRTTNLQSRGWYRNPIPQRNTNKRSRNQTKDNGRKDPPHQHLQEWKIKNPSNPSSKKTHKRCCLCVSLLLLVIVSYLFSCLVV